jgi:hypothetical protein
MGKAAAAFAESRVNLTAKQEAFAVAVAKGSNASDRWVMPQAQRWS